MSNHNKFAHPDCVRLSKKYTPDDYTSAIKDVCQCKNCGAYADTMANVVHHVSCKPGESKKWKDHYKAMQYKEA